MAARLARWGACAAARAAGGVRAQPRAAVVLDEGQRGSAAPSRAPVDGRNPFDVLRVARSASAHDIKAAYLQLCKQYHPDRFQNESARAAAQKEFLNIQAAFHAISTGQDMSSYSRASPRHAQHARARPEEAPIEHVYGIQGACVAIGTVLFGVVVWWWSSGVSDGTKHYDMTRMAREESLSQERRARMLQAHRQVPLQAGVAEQQ